jgi:hypothetical protein
MDAPGHGLNGYNIHAAKASFAAELELNSFARNPPLWTNRIPGAEILRSPTDSNYLRFAFCTFQKRKALFQMRCCGHLHVAVPSRTCLENNVPRFPFPVSRWVRRQKLPLRLQSQIGNQESAIPFHASPGAPHRRMGGCSENNVSRFPLGASAKTAVAASIANPQSGIGNPFSCVTGCAPAHEGLLQQYYCLG